MPNGAAAATEILARQRSFFETLVGRTKTSLPEVKVAFIYTWQDDENVAGSEYKCFGLIHNSTRSYAAKPIYKSFVAWATGAGKLTASIANGSTGYYTFAVDAIVDKYMAGGGLGTYGMATANAVWNDTYYTQSFANGQTLTSQ